MLPQVEDLMKELGWADGFCIPVANEENKALEKEVCTRLIKLIMYAPLSVNSRNFVDLKHSKC